ncbi:MAG: hypothetical protein GXP06_14460 [Alphaproteobacteria bacterium]|nr:hypothetical protein [Alphaproteobacteria bacterium]
MNARNLILSIAALSATACTHKVAVDDIVVRNQRVGGPQQPTLEERKKVAAETCEVQFEYDRQNYLSAVQSIISKSAPFPIMAGIPLDGFRAEINASYNTVVARCKTHTNCLEVKLYDEASCYMAASDRKDAERRFSDLAERLREIERNFNMKVAGHKRKKPVTKVNVQTTVTQTNDQRQTNDVQVGDDIADQDILILCGNAANLLDRRCREQ